MSTQAPYVCTLCGAEWTSPIALMYCCDPAAYGDAD